MQLQHITIRKPDDWHAHLRDGDMLRAVLPYTARDFARAIAMPNLVPAVNSTERMLAYEERIRSVASECGYDSFEPLMTLYLTEDLTVEEIEKAWATKKLRAIKYYPRGATTNSNEGVRSFDNVVDQLNTMSMLHIPLLIHGEENVDKHNRPIDPFDKERVFVNETLPKVRDRHPFLQIVLEHITTQDAVSYLVLNGGPLLSATITPHHLVSDRRALFDGGLNPHFFCLPVLKRERDMQSLRELATLGVPYVFAGTDTAPHPTHAKERACGCAGGCFVAPVALSMYAQVFEEEKALQHFEAFMSENGAKWYGLPLNEGSVTLQRHEEADAPDFLVSSYTEGTGEEVQKNAVRPFGLHTDPSKSMKWHWQVLRT